MTQSKDPDMFEVGDVVQLKSGGAMMTVAKLDEHMLECCWHYNGYNMQASYRPAMLRKVPVKTFTQKEYNAA